MILAFNLSDIVTVPFGWLLAQLYHFTDNYGAALIIFALAVQAKAQLCSFRRVAQGILQQVGHEHLAGGLLVAAIGQDGNRGIFLANAPVGFRDRRNLVLLHGIPFRHDGCGLALCRGTGSELQGGDG